MATEHGLLALSADGRVQRLVAGTSAPWESVPTHAPALTTDGGDVARIRLDGILRIATLAEGSLALLTNNRDGQAARAHGRGRPARGRASRGQPARLRGGE